MSIDDDESSGVGGGSAREHLYGDDEGGEGAMDGGDIGGEDEGRSVLSALGRPASFGGILGGNPGYAGGGAAGRTGLLERTSGSSTNGWIGSVSYTSAPSPAVAAAAGGMRRRVDRRADRAAGLSRAAHSDGAASGSTANMALSGDDGIVGRSGDGGHFDVNDRDGREVDENEMLRAWEDGGGGAAIGEEWVGAGRSMAFGPSPRDEMDGEFSGVVGDDGADEGEVERGPRGRRQLAASRARRVGMFEGSACQTCQIHAFLF